MIKDIQDWWKKRWNLAWTSPNPRVRVMSKAELVCMALSLLSMATLIPCLLPWCRPPSWFLVFLMPILASSAVGYLTNFVAVTMLFRPYSTQDRHWLRVLGRKMGLIPEQKGELAEQVSILVSKKLLTHGDIQSAVKTLFEAVLRSIQAKGTLRAALTPLLKASIPGFVKRLMPEVEALMKHKMDTYLSKEILTGFIKTSVKPWLKGEENRAWLAGEIQKTAQSLIPILMRELKRATKEYSREGFVRKFFMWAAKTSGALDWTDLRAVLEDRIADEDFLRMIDSFLAKNLAPSLQAWLKSGKSDQALEGVRGEVALLMERLIQKEMPSQIEGILAKVVESDAIWDWVDREGLPRLRNLVEEWIEGEGADLIHRYFDIQGRVKKAVLDMDVREIHETVDSVSAVHLSAIQVWGYTLGIAAGVALAFINGIAYYAGGF